MNRIKIVAVALLISLFAAVVYATPVSENGQLHVNGLQLTNSCGYPVQLRGVSTHGISWYSGCYTDALMDFVAYTMKADVFRIAMYTAASTNGYVAYPAWNTTEVEKLVDMATARGMYAIIDWHILSDADPNSNVAYAQTFFTDMANKYKDQNNVIYEICNEPNGVAVTWDVIKNYANVIIPLIRSIDPDAVIIVGTPNWSQLGDAVVASPLAYSNIMYAFHFYAGSHTTSMLTNYIGSLPIFCTEWGVSSSSGTGGDNYPNATNFINIMGGANTAGVTISWAMWSLADNTDTSSILTSGTCSSGLYDTAHLSTAGNFVYDKMNNPDKNFICGTYTNTPTNTPFAGSPTPTFTITATATMLPWDMIYDGDTVGYRLQDGTTAASFWVNPTLTPAPSGSITETTGGNSGNGILLSYINPQWWDGHSWSPSVAKTIGTNNNIEFDVKAVSGSVSKFLITLDGQAMRPDVGFYLPSGITTSWQTVRIPLSAIYATMPLYINQLDFVSNSNQNYTVMIDNIRLVSVPTLTPTITKTATITATITQTRTASPTRTVSPTFTSTKTVTPTCSITSTFTRTMTATTTPTVTPTSTATQTSTPGNVRRPTYVDISSYVSYPNPTNGSKVTFKYTVSGYAEKLTICVYTFGERKIYSVQRTNLTAGTYVELWIPNEKLANGLYYFTIEGTNGTRPIARHVSAFFVNKQVLTY
jgi:hypothetical protein